jgi:ERCC4-related helicase
MKCKNRLIPTKQCWVLSGDRLGLVLQTMEGIDGVSVKIRWKGGAEVGIVPLVGLRNGFQVGMEVQHLPSVSTRQSLGEGIVLKTRYLGGSDQLLVDFPSRGESHWLPFEVCSWTQGAKHRFITGDVGPGDAAERFRLKVLAHCLEIWNENTGALSKMEIDPLPHQIHLVHRILAEGHLNWLIADDVGLGKTIETGMLLKALEQRDQVRRILLITPAGLTSQWKEELHHKFGLNEFRIYGENFTIDEPREWKMYDHVIGSIDKLKDEGHLDSLLQAEPWDLVIFDEAHRLSRRQYGMKYDASQRFQLALTLRDHTQSMLLLSATPHQGKADKFHSLLNLLNPDRKDEIATLALNPEILSEMMIRNNKSDVTDLDGNFIFHGKTTKALRVEVDDAVKAFDGHLQKYLRQGYAAAADMGMKGNAIGFVMTVYRKLAASSAKAIHTALLRRKARLQGKLEGGISQEELMGADERFIGESEEALNTLPTEFFEGEILLLDELLGDSERILEGDRKLELFMEDLLTAILSENNDEKVLIFSEYRSTQEYIQQSLIEKFGESKVNLINGSMNHNSRRLAIDNFENEGQFLISTEAGGEGINLQKNCHVMVNYDLPWNPMRLVQRIGRLYRYGQKKRVVVFNIHSPGTADEQIMDLMYQRIDQVVEDLSTVGDEYNERLGDDIIGEVADMVDVEEILQNATMEGIERTEARIRDALDMAQSAAGKQRELFEYAASFDPSETRDEFVPTSGHHNSFVGGMFALLGIEIIEKTHKDLVWHIKLPEVLLAKLGIRRSRWSVTFDRLLASSRPNTHMLDMDNFLMQYLLVEAKSYEFMGQTAVLKSNAMDGRALITGFVRWQNEVGVRQRQEYVAWQVKPDGSVEANPSELGEFLQGELIAADYSSSIDENKVSFMAVEELVAQRLRKVSSRWLHPENFEPVAGAWL